MFYVAHWVACFRHFQTLAPTTPVLLAWRTQSPDADSGNGHLNYYIDDDWDHRYGGDDGAPFEGPHFSKRRRQDSTLDWTLDPRSSLELAHEDGGSARGKVCEEIPCVSPVLYTGPSHDDDGRIWRHPVVGAAGKARSLTMIIGGPSSATSWYHHLAHGRDRAVLYRAKVDQVKGMFMIDSTRKHSQKHRRDVKWCYSKHTNFDQHRLAT